jgi:hypothetical protein
MRSGSMVGIPETLSPQLAELFDPTAPKSVTSRLPEPLVFGMKKLSFRVADDSEVDGDEPVYRELPWESEFASMSDLPCVC